MATKYPPQLSLSEAIKIIKDIYTTHKSKEISIDLLPNILKVSIGSSYFPAKIIALQKFGFADRKPNGILELTGLAMQIIDPIGDEEVEAINISFNNDDVLAFLLEKYPNGNLPSPDQLKQTLMKSFNIPRETVNKWYQFVSESFRELNLKQSIGVNKGNTKNADLQIKPASIIETNIQKDFQNFVLPSGKRFSFSLEDEYTSDDLEFITDFFELKKKRIKK